MKTLNRLILCLFVMLTLASCEFDVATETTVRPDGSLDKTITIEKTDSTNQLFNTSSWESSLTEKSEPIMIDSTEIDSSKTAKTVKTFTRYHKKFNSVNEANAELSVSSDTLIGVTCAFDKKFRWFYTYITYSETYHALNRMKFVPDDYLTVEDYAFIDRLPGEGQKISAADELYLSLLRDKIFDRYGEKAIYEELYELAFIVVDTQPGIDSLKKHKNDFREALEKIDEKKNADESKFLLLAIDSFKIPINQSKVPEFEKSQKKLWKKLSFISSASDGKFINRINLPWNVVNSNADSVSGSSAFWAPPTIKFLLKDYTMYAEARKLNWWTVIVSALFIGFTGYLFIRNAHMTIRINDRVISIPRKETPPGDAS